MPPYRWHIRSRQSRSVATSATVTRWSGASSLSEEAAKLGVAGVAGDKVVGADGEGVGEDGRRDEFRSPVPTRWPSKNSTVPVGVPAPGPTTPMVAERVTARPRWTGRARRSEEGGVGGLADDMDDDGRAAGREAVSPKVSAVSGWEPTARLEISKKAVDRLRCHFRSACPSLS